MMTFKTIYPSLPRFVALCDKCKRPTSSKELFAVVHQPWAYVCEPCATEDADLGFAIIVED